MPINKRIMFLKDVDFLNIYKGDIFDVTVNNGREHIFHRSNKILISKAMVTTGYFKYVSYDFKKPKLYKIRSEEIYLKRYEVVADSREEAENDIVRGLHKEIDSTRLQIRFISDTNEM